MLLQASDSSGLNREQSDAEDARLAYAWRLQQEADLRASKGMGMTDEEVVRFVDACECYTWLGYPMSFDCCSSFASIWLISNRVF